MELPEEILAHIFSFLPLKDKCNASLVCKIWLNSLTWPAAWAYTEIRCDSKDCLPQRLFDLLPYIRSLKLIVSIYDPAHQDSVLWVLRQVLATGNGQLHGLCISYLENLQMYKTNQGLQQGMVDVFPNGSSLLALDLRGIPFILKHHFVKSIAPLCPALRSLFINNNSAVCGVGSRAIREVLKCCPLLNTFGLFQASVSNEVLQDLLKPHRAELKLLELRCDNMVKRVTPLSDQVWADVRHRHPGLRVNLEFDQTLSEHHILRVLQPSIPLRQLRIHMWTLMLNEIHMVLQRYESTLEVFELMSDTLPKCSRRLEPLEAHCRKWYHRSVLWNITKVFCKVCLDSHRYKVKK